MASLTSRVLTRPTTPEPKPWEDLPVEGSCATLDVQRNDSRHAEVRIDAVAAESLVITAPRYTGDLEPPHPEVPMSMSWCTLRGRFTVKVRFLERLPGRVVLWRVSVDGPPQREQRRAYVRAPASVPVRVTYLTDDGACELMARTVDLSEAASLVDLIGPASSTRPPIWSLPNGTEVDAALSLPEREVTVRAQVHWRAPENRTRVLLRFIDPPNHAATVLRRSVLEWQRRERALRVDA